MAFKVITTKDESKPDLSLAEGTTYGLFL